MVTRTPIWIFALLTYCRGCYGQPVPDPQYNLRPEPIPSPEQERPRYHQTPPSQDPTDSLQIGPCNPNDPSVQYMYGKTPSGYLVIKPGPIQFPTTNPIIVKPGAAAKPPSVPLIWIKPGPIQPPPLAPTTIQPPPVQPPTPPQITVQPWPVNLPKPPPIMVKPPQVLPPRLSKIKITPRPVQPPQPDLLVVPPRIILSQPPTVCFCPNRPHLRNCGDAFISLYRPTPAVPYRDPAPCPTSQESIPHLDLLGPSLNNGPRTDPWSNPSPCLDQAGPCSSPYP